MNAHDPLSTEKILHLIKEMNDEVINFRVKMNDLQSSMCQEAKALQERMAKYLYDLYIFHTEAMKGTQEMPASQEIYKQHLDQWKTIFPQWAEKLAHTKPPQELWKEYWARWGFPPSSR